MTGTEIQLLHEQLTAARRALAAGDEPLEVAALAGLLQRIRPEDPALDGLEIEVDRSTLIEAVHQTVELVLGVEEADDPAESWDALSAFDELCAAAAWLGASEVVVEAVSDVTSLVRAFPELWRPHATAATRILQAQPPRAGDPAARLWAAIETTPFVSDDDDAQAEAPLDLMLQLGLGPVITLAPLRELAERLHGADGLPEDAPWRRLGRGSGWELALTIDDQDRPILLLSGAPAGAFEHEGDAVEPTSSAEGLACPAKPGVWRVIVEGRELRFEVAE